MEAYHAAEAERAEYIRQDRPELLYYPLDAHQLRFVEIEPGQWHDPVICKLRVATFSSLGHYQALSYVWGSTHTRKAIQVNGRPLLVTLNLELALRFIRNQDESVTFWIDAICINQEDKDERNHQVALMKRIFTSAVNVVAYLGHPWTHHPRATRLVTKYMAHGTVHLEETLELEAKKPSSVAKIQSLATVSADSRVVSAQQTLEFLACLSQGRDTPSVTRMISSDNQGLFTDLFEGVRVLATSAWWTRVWILQEVILPRKVVVVYGNIVLRWSFLHSLANSEPLEHVSEGIPREYGKTLSIFKKRVCSIENKRQEWRSGFSSQGSSLFSLLREVGGRRATDDRDHIYALLGLVEGNTSINANYFTEVQDVYAAATVDILHRENGSLRALHGDLSRKGIYTLPSWVPDWSAPQDDIDKDRAGLMEIHARSAHPTKYRWVQEYPWNGSLTDGNFDDLHTMIDNIGGSQLKAVADLFRLAHNWNQGLATELAVFRLSVALSRGSMSWSRSFPKSDQVLAPTTAHELLHNIITFHHGQLFRCRMPYSGNSRDKSELYDFRAHHCGSVDQFSSPIYPLSAESRSAEVSLHIENVLHEMTSNINDIGEMWNPRYSISFKGAPCNVSVADLIRALLCDVVPDRSGELRRFDPRQDWVMVRGWWQSRRNVDNEATREDDVIDAFSDLDTIFLRGSYRRRFFVMSNGGCGWGPLTMKKGDRVYCPQTCSTPLLTREETTLRSTTPRTFTHKLVGDCFLLNEMGSGPSLHDVKQYVERLFNPAGPLTGANTSLFLDLVNWLETGTRHLKLARAHLEMDDKRRLDVVLGRVQEAVKKWNQIIEQCHVTEKGLDRSAYHEYLEVRGRCIVFD